MSRAGPQRVCVPALSMSLSRYPSRTRSHLNLFDVHQAGGASWVLKFLILFLYSIRHYYGRYVQVSTYSWKSGRNLIEKGYSLDLKSTRRIPIANFSLQWSLMNLDSSFAYSLLYIDLEYLFPILKVTMEQRNTYIQTWRWWSVKDHLVLTHSSNVLRS